MNRTHHLSLAPVLMLFAALLPTSASAQVATGTPPFGSFGGGPDVVNIGNLNVHWDFSILNKPGRGTNFTYDLTYDSSVWRPVTSGGITTWQPATTFGWSTLNPNILGYATYDTFPNQHCRFFMETRWITEYYTLYSDYVYVDAMGTRHAMSGAIQNGGAPDCGPDETGTATAYDGSGYTMSIPSETLYTTAGAVAALTGGTFTDRNGNKVSQSGGVFTDTLGTTVLTVTGSGTASSPYVFTYSAPSGVSAHCAATNSSSPCYTLNYTNFTVATNFGVTGINENKLSGAVPLPTSLVLPDGTQYTFSYETTPGTCTPNSGTTSCVTARLASIALPTGGTISYVYYNSNNNFSACTTGNNGIFSDGSDSCLQRTLNDGTNSNTWTYTRSAVSGNHWSTKVTTPPDPQNSGSVGDDTLIDFQKDSNAATPTNDFYETQRVVYQGASSSNVVLRTVTTCYNGNTSCTTTAVTSPISQRNITTTLQPSGLLGEHDEFWNSYGLLTAVNDYDFGSSPHGPLLSSLSIGYAALGNNLEAFPNLVYIVDGNGHYYLYQTTAYDQSGYDNATCVTGAPQHNDSSYGCSFTNRGNATSVTTYKTLAGGPSNPVTKYFSYDSLGNQTLAQVNCCQQMQWNFSSTTAWAYPDTIVRGPTGTQLTTSFSYDNNTGLVKSITDENSQQTSFSYDSLLRLVNITRPDSAQFTYSYAMTSTPPTLSSTAPIDSTHTATQTTKLDGLGRPIKATTTDANSTVYSIVSTQYDSIGRAYKLSNPYTGSPSYWTTYSFDALGRLTTVTLPDNSATTTTYPDATATTTDPTGKQRKAQNDALGRLVSVWEPDPSNNNSLTLQTTYGYDPASHLISITQSAQTRSYAYDGLSRLTSVATPEAGTTGYQYNDFNLLTQRTDARGVITTYGYDNLNRPASVSYNVGTTGVPATSSVSFGYGTSAAQLNNGRLITMTDGPGSEGYTWDKLGRLTQLQKVIGSNTYTTSYAYNFADELTQITYPSGRVVQQSVDAIGRVCEIAPSTTGCATASSPFATGFAYNSSNQIVGLKYGNAVFASFGFSPDRLQMNCLDYSTTNRSGNCTHDSTTKFGLTYSYGSAGSNNGQIASILDSVDNGRSVNYTYDSLYRLTQAVTTGSSGYPAWGLSQTYDRYGNRSAQSIYSGCSGLTCPTNSVTVSASTNQITGAPYGYDLNGNMTNDGLNTLVYDAENRPVSATNGGSSGTYTYDGNGLRVKKISGSTTTVYAFSGAKVVAEYDNGAPVVSPSREYIYSGDALLAKIDSSGTQYYHQDHLSNRLITDVNGNTVGQQGHFPFGEQWYPAPPASSATKWEFTSYERDAESSNDYGLARFHVNRLGRFSSPDRSSGGIDDPQSLNRYAYVLNDPCELSDPLGLNCTLKFGLMGQSLDPAAQNRVKETFQAAGVDVEFSSGQGDFNIQQNVDLSSRQAVGYSGTGVAQVDNSVIARAVFRANAGLGGGLNSGNALGIIISHEIGHLAIPCEHAPGTPDCGTAGLMRPGTDQGSTAFWNAAMQKVLDPSAFHFTDDQAKAIQKRCKLLRQGSKKGHGGGGGGGGPIGGNQASGGGGGGAPGLGELVALVDSILIEVVTSRILPPDRQ